MNHRLAILGVLCLAAPMAQLAGAADDEEPGQRTCINASLIRSTRIIDDANILFYVRGSEIYHNQLRRPCSGLAREGRFSYRRTTSSLCQQDSIRVLYSNGTGMREGPLCALGYFRQITEEDAEALLNPVEQRPPPEPLPPAEPEDVIPEDVIEEPSEPEDPERR